MTDDLEGRLRDLLQHAQLPSAPDRLHERLVQVATASPARRRPAFRGRWLLLPIVAILVVALAAGLVVVGGPPSQTSVTARSGDIQLTLSSAKSEYANGEKIDVSASVEYTGPNDYIQVSATQGSLVYFWVQQLDGSFLIPGGGSFVGCGAQTLLKGSPFMQPLGPVESYPGHSLSTGTYRITASASFGSTDCHKPIDLSASLVIRVSKYAASPSPTPTARSEPPTPNLTPIPPPTPPATPMFVTPAPGASTACGGYRLTVVNEETVDIRVRLNSGYTQNIAAGTTATLAQYLLRTLQPSLPWSVVVTNADATTQIGSVFLSGPEDQKLIVTGGHLYYGPYAINTDIGCSPPTPSPTPEPTPTPPPAPPGYSVDIAPGLHPKWTAELAAATEYSYLKNMEQEAGFALAPAQIIFVRARRGALVSREFAGTYPGHPVVWIVQAQGTFIADAGTGVRFGNQGFDVFDDDGNEIGGGVSGPAPDLLGHLTGVDSADGTCAALVDQQGTEWAVTLPPGFLVANDAGTIVLTTPLGKEISDIGIGMAGSATDQGSRCTSGRKQFIATSIVYLGPT